ncbi:MAG: NUDIX domain-containing protein [Chloroflexota bacterium]
MAEIGHFLGGVAALIWDPKTGRYLLLRRAATKDFLSGAWECVTGRVDQGESYTQALHREVMEEIGAAVQIEFIVGLTHFYRGPALPENELLGVIFGCTLRGPGSVSYGVEHSELRWVSLAEAEALLPPDHWLREVFRRAELLRAQLPDALRQEFHSQGFDL